MTNDPYFSAMQHSAEVENQMMTDLNKVRDRLAENLKNILISRRAQIGSETCKDAFCKGFDAAIEHTRKEAEACEAQNQRLRVDSKLNDLNELRDKFTEQTQAASLLLAALNEIGSGTQTSCISSGMNCCFIVARSALAEYAKVIK